MHVHYGIQREEKIHCKTSINKNGVYGIVSATQMFKLQVVINVLYKFPAHEQFDGKN